MLLRQQIIRSKEFNLMQKLNESTDNFNPTIKEVQEQAKKHANENKEVQSVFDLKSNQFKFDCGAFMANINNDIDLKFSLSWHKKHTNTVDDFIVSVGNFLSNSGYSLTTNDINRLSNIYENS